MARLSTVFGLNTTMSAIAPGLSAPRSFVPKRLTGDLVHRFLETEPFPLAHNVAEQARKASVKARMQATLYIESIADDGAQRLRQQLPEIGLALIEGEDIDQ